MPIANEDNEEWGINPARARLARVAAFTGLKVPDDAEFLDSNSNDAWRCGDLVVRVCFRGDRERLIREASVAAALPREVLYPDIVECGRDDDLSWMFVRRVEGVALWEQSRTMPEPQLRRVVSQFAEMLRVLHAWTPPADVLSLLRDHASVAKHDADGVVGHDLLALPHRRWVPLVEAAAAMPYVDAGIVRAAAERIDELAPYDPFAGTCDSVVHGDAGFSNVLAADGRITALLDYEWVRLGPRDAELVSLIRQDGQWRRVPPAYPRIVPWLRADYPEMFAAPDLRERVWLTELVYVLRQLVFWPPDGPVDTQVEAHPVHVLPRLVDAPWVY